MSECLRKHWNNIDRIIIWILKLEQFGNWDISEFYLLGQLETRTVPDKPGRLLTVDMLWKMQQASNKLRCWKYILSATGVRIMDFHIVHGAIDLTCMQNSLFSTSLTSCFKMPHCWFR